MFLPFLNVSVILFPNMSIVSRRKTFDLKFISATHYRLHVQHNIIIENLCLNFEHRQKASPDSGCDIWRTIRVSTSFVEDLKQVPFSGTSTHSFPTGAEFSHFCFMQCKTLPVSVIFFGWDYHSHVRKSSLIVPSKVKCLFV